MSNPFDMMRQQQERMRKQQLQDMQRKQQEQIRKQQEQMTKQGQETLRKMQEDARQRQMKGAYYEQQKQQAAIAPVADQFAEVERQAAELRQERAAGRLTEAELKTRLNDLMIQDASGTWWMVGTKSGEWHRSQGNKWVRASPTKPSGLKFSAPGSIPRVAPQRHRLIALITLPLGIALTLAVAYMLTWFTGSVLGASSSGGLIWLAFLVPLVLGLIITLRRVAKLWSGS